MCSWPCANTPDTPSKQKVTVDHVLFFFLFRNLCICHVLIQIYKIKSSPSKHTHLSHYNTFFWTTSFCHCTFALNSFLKALLCILTLTHSHTSTFEIFSVPSPFSEYSFNISLVEAEEKGHQSNTLKQVMWNGLTSQLSANPPLSSSNTGTSVLKRRSWVRKRSADDDPPAALTETLPKSTFRLHDTQFVQSGKDEGFFVPLRLIHSHKKQTQVCPPPL